MKLKNIHAVSSYQQYIFIWYGKSSTVSFDLFDSKTCIGLGGSIGGHRPPQPCKFGSILGLPIDGEHAHKMERFDGLVGGPYSLWHIKWTSQPADC